MRQKVYYLRMNCRACDKNDFELLLDFGDQPLAGGFITQEELPDEKLYPLSIYICRDCGLVQTFDVIPPDVLFKNYLFASSTVSQLVTHFANYATWIKDRFDPRLVVEFGSNDGVLLSPLSKLGIQAVGVDISENISGIARGKGLRTVTGYLNCDMAKDIVRKHGNADIVTGSNAFPHNNKPGEILDAAKILLKQDGYLCLEMMYAGSLLEKCQWDSMYHEHLSYFSLTTLDLLLMRYGFHAVHAEIVPMHAGSLRVVAAANRDEEPDSTVYKMLDAETNEGVTGINKWREFAAKAKRQIKVTREVLHELEWANRIWAYGASGRATMWLNNSNLDYIEAIVDESPLRAGKCMPGVHIPVVLPDATMALADYCLILAWNYAEQIMRKESWYKGIWVIPAPELKFL
jgi:novobiocin biosynthesis protein NovU/D-mycarose 3-C-methyltransferase